MSLDQPDGPGSPAQTLSPRRRRGLMPPEFMDLVRPSGSIGLMAGGVGAFAGAATAIARDMPTGPYSLLAGFQCFALGSSFWFSRSAILHAYGEGSDLSRKKMLAISTASGAAAGLVGGMIRGPSNIIPGIVMFSIFGVIGQAAVHKAADYRSSPVEEKPKQVEKKTSWLRSKWNPLKEMTDDEYIAILNERLLKFDVDISLIDDRIAALRQQSVSAPEK